MEGFISSAMKVAEEALRLGHPTSFAWLQTVRDMKKLTGAFCHWRIQLNLQVIYAVDVVPQQYATASSSFYSSRLELLLPSRLLQRSTVCVST
ncbi:hypothetical protein cyc_09124 [Cyclospora cayetanensis]|uniref:Uncharacterized protein n=1 Tax=Cyclospora cayetanensis TaxID=88456 RepID=A0A1D3D5P7_9EIME|nr:hypothetical protein cyc_09124 [Cyclospora cayetanensis]